MHAERSDPSESEQTAPRKSGAGGVITIAVLCAVAGFGLLFFYSDGVKLADAAAGISWARFALPIGATLFSYVLMALSYDGIAAAAGSPVGFVPMLRITFVSNTVNYLVATGGLSGFAVRMYLFRRHGIPMGRAVTISFVQGLLTNLALLVFLVMGFYFLVRHESLGIAALAAAGGLLGVFILIMGLCVVLLLQPKSRRRVLLWCGGTIHRLAVRFLPDHRVPHRMHLWRVLANVDEGFHFMVANWRSMLVPTIYIFLDWVATLAVLWGCFWTVDLLVAPALITVGFSVAILSSMVSLAPGGLGIMESLTTALFATLGTPLAPTVIALILFRLSYYALPFIVSLVFFRSMLHDARQHSH
ncbi:MAG: flippase-like domain-containing protein [Candidatus Binatia bacterium]|nr:flippase-like domain-containing protein [Candidatus Binatia bacterium]